MVDQRLQYGTEIDAVNRWCLDTDGETVLACIRVASAPVVHVAITVRRLSRRQFQLGEFAIFCLGSAGDSWRLEHGVYDARLPPPHPLLPDMALLLTNAPEDVGMQLARL